MLPLFLVFNFVILFGPLLLMNLSQIRGFEPGDAEWGVRLEDVRGQAEAKEEVRRVVALWQSGEAFERAGGKRERGLLFLGAPGTGKTMLAKAIATGFNSPFVSIPGSGFAATFIGIDAIVVRYVAWKAKRLARKWGGQCIVFIDEIDAVGMRRNSLNPGMGGAGTFGPVDLQELLFFGPNGALNPERRPHPRDARLARAAVRRAGGVAARARSGVRTARQRARRLHVPRRDAGRRRPRAEPAARGDGRDRQPAVRQARDDEPDEHVPRRDVHRPAPDGQHLAPAAPAAPARGADLLHRRDERADRPARSGADPAGPDGPARLVPDADEARPARRLRPLPRQGRPRPRPRHRRSAATSWPGSPTATRRR